VVFARNRSQSGRSLARSASEGSVSNKSRSKSREKTRQSQMSEHPTERDHRTAGIDDAQSHLYKEYDRSGRA
jgi:hypothetical protein